MPRKLNFSILNNRYIYKQLQQNLIQAIHTIFKYQILVRYVFASIFVSENQMMEIVLCDCCCQI